MGASGVIRKIDKLGRIVIPVEFRKTLNIHLGEEVEIMLKGNTVMLQKHEERCVFCGSAIGLENVLNKKICEKCKVKMACSYRE